MNERKSLCAWCRHEYGADGAPGRRLTDAEYEVYSADPSHSHGCCRACAQSMSDENDRIKIMNKRRQRQSSRANPQEVKQPWEMTREKFGSGVKNDWPLKISSKGMIQGDAAVKLWHQQNPGTAPYFRTPKAAQKWVDKKHKKQVRQAIAEGKIKSHPDYPDLTPTVKKSLTVAPKQPKVTGNQEKQLAVVIESAKKDSGGQYEIYKNKKGEFLVHNKSDVGWHRTVIEKNGDIKSLGAGHVDTKVWTEVPNPLSHISPSSSRRRENGQHNPARSILSKS